MTSPTSGTDRTVHGITMSGWKIVRYDRAGKWYIEGADERQHVGVGFAARLAALGNFYPGLPGGKAFDRRVREIRGNLAAEARGE